MKTVMTELVARARLTAEAEFQLPATMTNLGTDEATAECRPPDIFPSPKESQASRDASPIATRLRKRRDPKTVNTETQTGTQEAMKEALKALTQKAQTMVQEAWFCIPEELLPKAARHPTRTELSNPIAPLVREAVTLPQDDFMLPNELLPTTTTSQRRETPGRGHQASIHIIQLNANGIGAIERRAEIIKYAEETKASCASRKQTSAKDKTLPSLKDGRRRAEVTEDTTGGRTQASHTDTEGC